MTTPEHKAQITELLKCDTFKTRIINGSEQCEVEYITYTISNNPIFDLKNTNDNISIMQFDNSDTIDNILDERNVREIDKDTVTLSTNKKQKLKINYKLSPDTLYKIQYNGNDYVFYINKEGLLPIKIKYKVDFYMSLHIYYTCDNKEFEDLCIMCNDYYEEYFLKYKNTNDHIGIYLKCDYGFEKINKQKTKQVDTLYLPKKQITNLLNDVDMFFKSEELYNYLDINYKRCYLFEGVWGSGKTSTIRTIASKYNHNISIIAFDAELTDSKLFECLQHLPSKTILVLEDIDCLFKERKENDATKNMVTFSSLLNILDGMMSKHGLITIMTTNYKLNLDKALIRPGRVDYILHFDFMKKSEIKNMFNRFMFLDEYKGMLLGKPITIINKEKQKEYFELFYESYKKLNIQITASLLQQFFFKYINNPINIIDNINELKELYDTITDEKKDLYT